jgi:hypothetical protein
VITYAAFHFVLSLMAALALILCAIIIVALVRGAVRLRRACRSRVVLPQIRDALVDHVSGSNDLSRLQQFARTDRADFERAVLAFQGSLGGSAFERLCSLALDLGLVKGWIDGARSRDVFRRRACFTRLAFVSAYEPCRRITSEVLGPAADDADPEVRLAAARALLYSGQPEDVERVFRKALSETLLLRILLTEDLRAHASTLSQAVIPDILRFAEPRRLAAVLEMLAAWERAIPITDLGDLLEHVNPRVRLAAIRLAALLPDVARQQGSILTALDDSHPEIFVAAARASARIPLPAAMPALARSLRLGPARSARAAAAALAGMPPRGWETLEELSTYPSTVTAAAAREALARILRRMPA